MDSFLSIEDSLFFTDSLLCVDSTYSYKFYGLYDENMTDEREESILKIFPDEITNFVATAVGRKVTFTWEFEADYHDGFMIYKDNEKLWKNKSHKCM